MGSSYHFLDFDFLEGSKTAGSCLHMQGTMYTVLLAFVSILAILNGGELFIGHLLEGLRTTDVAGVCVDKEKRFDFGHSGNNPPYRDQPSEVESLNLSYGHGCTLEQRFEIQVTRITLGSESIA